ncbi:MAG: class I SAM-dependent methyltransferase [Candidatus Obscuribacterales bacterium]|nr:class I SAM-dependent methyltransferase [Candidatus Obscuribacterales bacterium]
MLETENREAVADSSLRYDYQQDKFEEDSHYGRLLHRVGKSKRVLELGSSTGYLTQAMQERFGCRVTGVEIDPDAAQKARDKGLDVRVLDLDFADLSVEFAGEKFEAVLLADVLEHLRDPAATLGQISKILAPGGKIVASIPHAGHGDIKMALLTGRLPFRPMGLLDHTHVKFFTRSLVEDLFIKSGYRIDEIERNRWNTSSTEVSFAAANALPENLAELKTLLDCDPEGDTYQFIVQASLSRDKADQNANENSRKNLPSIDIVVFETALQKACDLYHAALRNIDYPQTKLKFWFVSGEAEKDQIQYSDSADKASPPMAASDFRSFRFLSGGSLDQTPEHARDCILKQQSLSARAISNRGRALKKIAMGSNAELLFVLNADSLPAGDCLYRLAQAYEKLEQRDKQLTVLCARAEVRQGQGPARPDASLSRKDDCLAWHEFSAMLLPKALVLGDFPQDIKSLLGTIDTNKSKLEIEKDAAGSPIDSSFLTEEAQAQDFCFRIWQLGGAIREVYQARYYSNGPRLRQGSADERKFDGMRLRRRWGTSRQLLSFARAKEEGQSCDWLRLFNHLTAAMIVEKPTALPQSEPGKSLVGFHGPHSILVGATPR